MSSLVYVKGKDRNAGSPTRFSSCGANRKRKSNFAPMTRKITQPTEVGCSSTSGQIRNNNPVNGAAGNDSVIESRQ